ncbi:MAG: hypothetical protein ACO3C1_09020 [Ilumatobacteraceae bacterium]
MASRSGLASAATRRDGGVPNGPRAYRTRVRRGGALVALVPMALLAVIGRLLLRGDHGTTRAVLSLGCSVLAAPFLLVVGVPLTDSTAARASAVALSVVLWAGLGLAAARRATRRPAATWREFWLEFAWSAAAVWVGVVAGLVVADAVLGRPLI